MGQKKVGLGAGEVLIVDGGRAQLVLHVMARIAVALPLPGGPMQEVATTKWEAIVCGRRPQADGSFRVLFQERNDALIENQVAPIAVQDGSGLTVVHMKLQLCLTSIESSIKWARSATGERCGRQSGRIRFLHH